MKTYTKILLSILFASLLTPLAIAEDGHGHGEHEEGEHEEGVVSLSEQQVDTLALKLTPIKKRYLDTTLSVTGRLALAPQDQADISPMIGGIVKKINVFEGDRVKKGQVLAVLEHPDYIQLQEDYLNTLHQFDYLTKEFERQKKLYSEKVGSGKEYQRTKANFNKSKSKLSALEAKLKMMGFNIEEIQKGELSSTMDIVSPMSGMVSLVETNIGSYAEPLSKLFEVVDNDKLHADFMVYEKDINKIAVGQEIYFSVSSYPQKEHEAIIYAISPAFEKNPRSIHVHAKMSTHNKSFIEGMYIQGRVVSNSQRVFALPEDAIVVDQGKSYIFMKKNGAAHEEDHGEGEEVHGDEHEETNSKEHDHDKSVGDSHGGHSDHEGAKWKFEMIEIVRGVKNNGYIEIKLLSPLPDHAKFAANGAYYLMAEMNKGETEHSH